MTQGVVVAVCRLASDLAADRLITAVGLIGRSGYLDAPSGPDVTELEHCLGDHPDWVDAWLAYSEDKRTSSGWYVIERSARAFEVGFLGGTSATTLPLTFDDRVRACAEFVRAEIADIAERDEPRQPPTA